MIKKNIQNGLLLCCCLLTSPTWAINVNVNITGELYIPPCTINNNNNVNISFGKIINKKINGQNYLKTIVIPLQCEYEQGVGYVRILGIPLPNAPDNVLLTNSGINTGKLGIAMYQGGSIDKNHPLKIGNGTQNKGFKITTNISNQHFIFTIVPFKINTDKLVSGDFTASATMDITYL